MELKLQIAAGLSFAACLLIVPYGIETKLSIVSMSNGTILLIVPYGIET